MNKSESKYFNTALKMDEALVDILREKGLEYVTVKEICEKAGVNRSTFYLHYETIDDLLTECVENTNKKFMSYFEGVVAGFPDEISSATLDDLIFIRKDYLIPYLNFVKENRFVLAAAINSPDGMRSVQKFEGLYKHIFDPILERFDYPESERSYAIIFYISGIMAVINQWLKDGCTEETEYITGVIIRCIRPYME